MSLLVGSDGSSAGLMSVLSASADEVAPTTRSTQRKVS